MLVRILRSWDGGDVAADPDGFVHLSFACHVTDTIRRHYADAESLVLLVVHEASLPPGALRVEETAGRGAYPHLYATLPASAVVRAVPWRPGDPIPR